MVEPVQGEGGVIPTTTEFMEGLRALTHEHKVLLIVDEVQAGCGRTGKLFAYQHYNIKPDIMTLGKGIGGGVPLAALLATEEVCLFCSGRSRRYVQRQCTHDCGWYQRDRATTCSWLFR
jgi:acetylornithine/N-succinyldiaminopimelate aminotransferase